LSGWIDPSAILALAAREGGTPITAFTAGFDRESDSDEIPPECRVAAKFGVEHHEIRIKTGGLRDVIVSLADDPDQPFGDAANIPLHLLCRELDGRIKVVLERDDGDEMSGGCSNMRPSGECAGSRARSPSTTRPSAWDACSPWRPQSCNRHVYCRESSERRARTTTPSPATKRSQAPTPPTDPVRQILLTDAMIQLPYTFLEKADRPTLLQAIESCVPFLDDQLVELALGLPGALKVTPSDKKSLLREVLRGVVPDRVLGAPKRGFRVPYEQWIRSELNPLVREVLHDEAVRQAHLFDCSPLDPLLESVALRAADHEFAVYEAVQLAAWPTRQDATLPSAPAT